MKLLLFPSSACIVVGLPLLVALLSPTTHAKPIRLRNETIFTEYPTNAAAKAQGLAAQAPAAGLFLVQFQAAVTPAWQAELRSLGVELLKYVPEDAFIARFRNAPPGQVRALSFVRWVGPYRPDYKIHPRLAAAARATPQTNQTMEVTVVLSPRATPTEIAQVRALFPAVAQESRLRQGTFLRGTLPPANVETLAQLDSVLWIERTPRRKLLDEPASKLVGGDDGQVATPTVTQQLGFDGTGVTICVADTGLDSGDPDSMHPDLEGRVIGFSWYGNNISDGSDGYGHGTHCAGIAAGNAATGETNTLGFDPEFELQSPDSGTFYGLGVAPNANLFIERIFDDQGLQSTPFPNLDALARDAVTNGAAIGSHSWGNEVHGEYDSDAAQFDELVRNADISAPGDHPYIVVFAAGNAGPGSQTLYSPASAKNVIAVGASQNMPGTIALTYGLYADGPDAMADFSSRGPCEDGRLKPDVVAPGTWIASAASSYAWDIASVSWTAIDDYYTYMGGTSMAAPHVAGAAAVFVQYYKSLHTNAMPSPALVKAALINSANALDPLNGGPGPIPNSEEGWGRVTLTNIIVTNLASAPRYHQYLDQTVLLTNGQVHLQHALVRGSGQPLKITLAYTDEPAFAGAIPALVNDLDLELIAPDGTLYRGNQFAGSDSAPNAPSPDSLNNVEGVHLTQPLPGDYLVRVRGRHIVQDAYPRDTTSIEQDFALVVSGDLARPGEGSVLLDRPAYAAPGVVRLTVFDPARAASNSVSVLLRSTITETAGENFVLTSSGNYGAFTGAVATVLGVAVADGELGINAGDTIQARYLDSSATMRVATAVADLVWPVISAVATHVDLGVITVSWQTSEPAWSVLRYGTSTNSPFPLAVTNSLLTASHSFRLGGLTPGQTYYFYVVSADAAGNAATNNNAGKFFSFVAVPTPTVLLVDAYEPVSGSPDIPDSTYTNALAAAGYSFAHWKVSQRGSPQLSDLQPFPVVVWRLIDDVINYGLDDDLFPDPSATNNTLTAQEQVMLQDYLNSGGSFFMASMGILSQVGNVPFRRNVLQVGTFKQNPDPLSSCMDCDEDFGVPAILGAAGNPLTGGIALTLDYSLYPGFEFEEFSFGPDFSDTFTPATNASPILFHLDSGRPCGMTYPRVGVDSPGRMAFLSFPLETVPPTGASPNTRAALLGNILQFLTPGANGVGSITLNRDVYSIPDQIIVEVGDSDRAGVGFAQATFSTSSSTNQVTLQLYETIRPGLFRGFLTLAATNGANQLGVLNGDTVTAAYFDTSNSSDAVATATIDTVSPVITGVSAVTGFGDATVSWATSKPADSLVQYGESVLLGRTAYSGALVTSHSVLVSGLQANRDYYYQVVSRDAAGNTTVDNNTNAFYTFTTRPAPRPPLFEDFENGAADWTVMPSPTWGSSLDWSLGTPANGLQTSAYSGTNAWGSNLHDQTLGFPPWALSFLYSPIIDLSGFSTATLTFWHCYNFSAESMNGQLCISTNGFADPDLLPYVRLYQQQAVLDWEEVVVDLTAFVGQTIQLVWFYQGSTDGDGWLVDDVNITGVAGGGTIVVSKNIGQGKFTLTGPVGQSGTAALTTLTNAPPGPYSVHFSDVTFYQTPPDQTLILTGENTITFTGNYTFLDINRNGISDSWERYYFEVASTNRTQQTDSDADGMSDYAEFTAGTNPTNPASRLVFLSVTTLTNQLVQLDWAAIPGRLYQVQTVGGLPPQAPPTLSGSFAHPGGAFTLHVEAPANVPYVIQASTNLSGWISVHTNAAGGNMDWLDLSAVQSARRFYRTLIPPPASTNLQAWTPVSDWLQATASPMHFTVTNTPAAPRFYRIQVRP